MAIYEYFCKNCNYKFEQLRSMADANKDANCPKCNNPAKRSLSRFACFTKDDSGISSPISGTGSSCSGCSSSSCSTCGM